MKPSQRIQEILLKEMKFDVGEPSLESEIVAIEKYLDEQYLKKHNHPEGLKCNEC